MERVRSVSDVADAVTISNHLTALLNDGKSDVVNLLIGYIDNTTYSVHRCREIIQLVKTADTNIILDLVEGRITGNQFILHCRRNKPVNTVRSFDEIYSEIKDTDYSYQTHINNTADLFNKGVDYLEEIVERLLSEEYISTFEESDADAHRVIADCLERLTQVHTVISSLI